MEDRGRECLLDSPENKQERWKQVSEDGGQCQNISNFNNNIKQGTSQMRENLESDPERVTPLGSSLHLGDKNQWQQMAEAKA